ncbi:MAG: ATP synthase subunit C [Gammaproteobacteria bacterium]|nr:ATP synthase subunit C [Gammaproteobacteria bacterium]
MYWLIGAMTLLIIGIIATGVILQRHPERDLRAWFKPTLATNLLIFIAAQGTLIVLGIDEAMANPAVAEAANDISIGMAVAFIGVGIPTAFSTLGAAYAVGSIGAASLAVLAERPEVFGRTLIYLGLAEGIAIYGLVISILLLDKL